jgi:TolB-like protein
MLGSHLAPRMSKERDRAPLSTKIAPLATEVTLLPFNVGRSESLDCEDTRRGPWDGSETSACDQRLAVGQRLSGRYRIQRELGEGGMGVVYLARDEQVTGEIFAVKVLKQTFQPDALALLTEEVHKTRRLSHPNIVDVHSVNVDGTKLYVLMEYLEGKSIDALLDEEFGRGMPLSRAWQIIEEAGAALGYAHDHNVVHSDIKPANIFVTTSGRTKLLDFGIARVSRGRLLHKPSGPLALTPEYASCEMLAGREADPRDDVYSFACVIHEMLCGKRPYGELTALEACEASAQVAPLELLSRGQNAALRRALAFGREARTVSVEKLLGGLVANEKPRARPNALVAGASIAVAAAALGLSYWWINKFMPARSVEVQSTSADARPGASHAATAVGAFNPPTHSIAVLPFENLSGDTRQEYFSDGLTEELLNSLSRLNELQVVARTSSFYFKGEHADLSTIAHKLNVATVLEGSVRRSEHTVRITAQLVNTVTGFHLWSQTYDRPFRDVLKLQTEIAAAVTGALKVQLLSDFAARVELGGTQNAAAFDTYLRAAKAYQKEQNPDDAQAAIVMYTEAVRLDPNFALAFAGRSIALYNYTIEYPLGPGTRDFSERARTDAHKAIALAPELAEGHLALAFVLEKRLEFASANEEYERALTLAPGNARVLRGYSGFAALMGHSEAGIAAARHALALDPLNPNSSLALSDALFSARRYEESIAAVQNAKSLDPASIDPLYVGLSYFLLGDFQRARSSCELSTRTYGKVYEVCLAVTYGKLGMSAEAQARLAKYQTAQRNVAAYQYAMIYAQSGDTAKALEWLDTAMQLRDPGLRLLKTDAFLDPLRNEPRFQAIERELKFPN